MKHFEGAYKFKYVLVNLPLSSRLIAFQKTKVTVKFHEIDIDLKAVPFGA